MFGKVIWYSYQKGYGFIAPYGDVCEHYFDKMSIIGSELPASGDEVEFDSIETKKGKKAIKIYITNTNRVICLNCDKEIVPRLIYKRGFYGVKPIESICPFCSFPFQDFSNLHFISMELYNLYIKLPTFFKYLLFLPFFILIFLIIFSLSYQ